MDSDEKPDPLIDEIHAIRAQIAAEHGNDPQRLIAHYIEYQKQFKDRLIPPPVSRKRRGRPAA
jgi:hypothetical protein